MLYEIKKRVLNASIKAQTSGLCHEGGGNFSEISSDRKFVVITPHAESRYSLTPDDLIVIDLKGNVIENKKELSPSSEWPMHLHIYNEKPEIRAVCHTHAKNAAVFACLGFEVKPVIFEALMYGGFCKVMAFEEPGSVALGESAVRGLIDTYATILGHHGLLTVGSSIEEALLRSFYVEDVCDAHIKAASMVGNDNVPCFTKEQIIYFRDVLGMKA